MTTPPMNPVVDRDGRDSRWDTHRSARRAELVEATLSAIRSTDGSPSMEEIAEAAGTSKAVLYRYFGDQAGLFAAVAERIDGVFLRRLEAAIVGVAQPRQQLYTLIAVYLELIEVDPGIYRFLEHQSVLDKRQVEYPSPATVRRATSLFGDVVASDGFGRNGPLLMAGVVSLLRTTADSWISTRPVTERVSRIALAEDLTELLWSGLPAVAH